MASTGFWTWAPNGSQQFIGKAAAKALMGQTSEGDTPAANGATPVAVADTHVTAVSRIDLTLKTVGGTVASAFVVSKTPGTGFSFQSAAGNTSVYHYTITEP